MKQLIEYILQNSLPENTEFSVVESRDEIGLVYTISAPSEVRGQLIGKAGRNIRAIRDLAAILARRDNERVFIKIQD